jgi:hypothetical protein
LGGGVSERVQSNVHNNITLHTIYLGVCGVIAEKDVILCIDG